MSIVQIYGCLNAKNATINAGFTAIPVCLQGRLNRKFTVTKDLSKNRMDFPGL